MPGQRPQRHTQSSVATREKEGPGDVTGRKAKRKAIFFSNERINYAELLTQSFFFL